MTIFFWAHQGARVDLGAARGALGRAPDAHATCASAASPTTSRPTSPRRCCALVPEDRKRPQGHRRRRSTRTDLPRPHGRHRRSSRRRTRSATAGPARALRSTGVAYDVRKDAPVPRLRPLRLRRAGRLARATTSIASSCASRRSRQSIAHPRAGASSRFPPGPVVPRRSAHRPAAQAGRLQHHRGHDRPLQDHRRRHQGAAGRGLLATPRAATASSASTSSPTAPAAPTSAACARPASHHRGAAGDDHRQTDRRHRADLRHDEHDRRRV